MNKKSTSTKQWIKWKWIKSELEMNYESSENELKFN
jgi:hypothetical protein